jgi:tetratricopeptide (TPR) repeat protein
MSRRHRVGLGVLAGVLMAVVAVAQPGDDPIELVKEGRKLNAAGKQAEALALYERALKIDPGLFDAHLAAGIALDLQGNHARAKLHLTRALDLGKDGQRGQALSALAVSYTFERRVADAASHYQRQFDERMKAEAYDGAAATANALGRVYLETGDVDNAMKWYETGYRTSRKLTSIPLDQSDLWEMRWEHALSRIAARRGSADGAAAHAATVKVILDKGRLGADQLPAYHYLIGYNALHLGRIDDAIAELLQADQRDPFILGLLAQAYEKKGDAAKARQYYGLVMESNAHSLQNAFARPLAKERLAAGSQE